MSDSAFEEEVINFEKIIAWTIALFFIGIFVFIGINMMVQKTQLCKDIGTKIYGHWLSWFQCIVL